MFYVFSFTYILIIKFNLQMKHSERLTTTIINGTIITIYCNKIYVNVVSFSEYLIGQI